MKTMLTFYLFSLTEFSVYAAAQKLYSRNAPIVSTKQCCNAKTKPYIPNFVQFERNFNCTRRIRKVTHCIFDLDGTLLDSEQMYHKMMADICKKYGKKYTKEEQLKNYGLTDRDLCTNVVRDLQLGITVDQLERELEQYCESALPRAPLQKGVERLLNHLHESGVPFALATNSTARAVRLHAAARPKLFGMFHHMVSATDPDVDRGKPHPDIYLVAASKFAERPKPAKCLVFEDSKAGLEAGVTAGMQVVFTPHGRIPPASTKKATVILKSLLEFKPELFGIPPFKDKADFTKKRPRVF